MNPPARHAPPTPYPLPPPPADIEELLDCLIAEIKYFQD